MTVLEEMLIQSEVNNIKLSTEIVEQRQYIKEMNDKTLSYMIENNILMNLTKHIDHEHLIDILSEYDRI